MQKLGAKSLDAERPADFAVRVPCFGVLYFFSWQSIKV